MISHRNPILAAFLVACLGIGLFSVMDAVVKHVAILIGAYNAMLWRQITSSMIGGVGFVATRSAMPSRAALRLTALRGGLGACMAFTFFWGIVRVPLAEGIALSFIAPLVALYLASVLLGERVGRGAIAASALGMAGVLVIVAGRIGTGQHDRDTMMGIGSILVSSLLYAYNLILQRQQAQISSPVQIAFFQNLFALCVTALLAPFLAALPPPELWPFIVLSAALTYTSLFLLAWAYARAEAQVLLPVEYTAFLWAALFGWWFFGEAVTLTTFAGTVLIVGGCILSARLHRNRTDHIEMP